MTEFLTSKWHTLDDKEFTLMLEPYPGTQVIYEHLGNCPTVWTTVKKVYPPNTTLIVNNPCGYISFWSLGEITKFVVEENYGDLRLGGVDRDAVYTKEVVVKSNHGDISLKNSMDRIEIQENTE